MDFPPIKQLISATFDGLNQKEPLTTQKTPPRAPQPVANAAGMGEDQERLGLNSAAQSGTNRVGTLIDTRA